MKYNPYILTALAQLIEISTSSSLGTSTLSDQSTKLLKLANLERVKVGIQPLIINSALSNLASIKSQDMVVKDYFSHNSPTYGSAFDMMRTHGINYHYAGENLAVDRCAENAHTAWMNSTNHKKNILNPSFTEMGIGIHAKLNGSFVYTQLFIGY